jgi:hypothetical protein
MSAAALSNITGMNFALGFSPNIFQPPGDFRTIKKGKSRSIFNGRFNLDFPYDAFGSSER